MTTIFINSKPTVINGITKKMRNPPSWLVIFVVIYFHKILLFSEDLITFIIFWSIRLSPAFAKIYLFNFLAPIFFGSFTIERINRIIPLLNIISDGRLYMNPLKCTNLDDWVFKTFILVDETFAKALRMFETCISVNITLNGQLFYFRSDLMKDWKLLQFHWLVQISIYWDVN